MSNDPTTTFYPYDVCLDGGFVSEHLAILDKLCTLGCAEYSELKKEVTLFESQHAKK